MMESVRLQIATAAYLKAVGTRQFARSVVRKDQIKCKWGGRKKSLTSAEIASPDIIDGICGFFVSEGIIV